MYNIVYFGSGNSGVRPEPILDWRGEVPPFEGGVLKFLDPGILIVRILSAPIGHTLGRFPEVQY